MSEAQAKGVTLTESDRLALFFILDDRCFEEELNPTEYALLSKLEGQEGPIDITSDEASVALKYTQDQCRWTLSEVRLMRKLDPEWPN